MHLPPDFSHFLHPPIADTKDTSCVTPTKQQETRIDAYVQSKCESQFYFDLLPLSFLTLWPLGTPLQAFGCQYQQNMETTIIL